MRAFLYERRGRPHQDHNETDHEKKDNTPSGVFDADLMAPNLTAFPLLSYVDYYEAILEAGEVIFIPANCPHQVINLDMVRVR